MTSSLIGVSIHHCIEYPISLKIKEKMIAKGLVIITMSFRIFPIYKPIEHATLLASSLAWKKNGGFVQYPESDRDEGYDAESGLVFVVSRAKTIEITSDSLKTKNIEVRISDIEKIIIEGYFIQKIGIKQYGKRLGSPKLYFRFKDSEESQIKEWVNWAENAQDLYGENLQI